MRAEQFLSNVKTDNQIFFLCGQEGYLIDKVREAIVHNLSCDELNTDVRDDGACVDDIISVADQMPCFAPYRIVILNDPALLKNKDGEAFAEYLKNMPESTKMLIISRQPVDKRRSIYKFLQKNSMMIEAEIPDDDMLVKWVLKTAGEKGISIKDVHARFLLDVCGRDMYLLGSEIDKLSMLGKSRIEKADIENAVSASNEYSVFLLHTHMMKNQYKSAFELTKKIYGDEKTFIPLIALLSGKFEQMLTAKELMLKGKGIQEAAQEMARQMKINPVAAKYAAKECGEFEIEALKNSVKLLAEYEHALKSGGVDPGIENVLIKLYRKNM